MKAEGHLREAEIRMSSVINFLEGMRLPGYGAADAAGDAKEALEEICQTIANLQEKES